MRQGGGLGPARNWFVLIVALAALGVAVPAAQSGAPNPIVGGEAAAEGEYPAQGFLEFDLDGDELWDWFCGGTLVAPTKILTAAHCATDVFDDEVPAASVSVYMGENERTEFTPSHRYGVSDVDVHENYNSGSMVNDVAMLTLSSASPHQPLRVVKADETSKWAAGIQATIVGWGTTEQGGGGPDSNELLEARVPIVSDAECSASYGRDFRPTTMVCAYDGTHDTCQGDSGGPLMVPDSGGFALAGITSWGFGCADEGFPGVYTRVGAPALNAWIHSRLPVASPPPPPPPSPTPPPPSPPPPPPAPTPPPPAPTPPPPAPPAPTPTPTPTPPPPVLPPAPPPPAEPQPAPRVARCVVPRLKGKTLLGARRALARADCRLGRVTRSYSATVALGRVVRQQPVAGRRLAPDTRIGVVLSRGKRKR